MLKDGKLFGKLNIIDLLVILIVIGVAAALALKSTGNMEAAIPEVGTNIRYTVSLDDVEPELYEAAKAFVDDAKAQGKPGDQLMSNGACLPAYVTDITAVPSEQTGTITVDGTQIVMETGEETVDVTFTIEGYVDNNTKTELGSQEVRVGKTHIVKTTHFEFSYCTIMTCEWENGTSADN